MTEKRPLKSEDVYDLRKQERLFDRISHERFTQLLDNITTRVHLIQVSANNYGEFLFMTTSRTVEDEMYRLTFWGLGYHEYRDRWLEDEWFWYAGYTNPDVNELLVEKDDVQAQLTQRTEDIRRHSVAHIQTQRGQFFEILADLTDDDGTIAEL